MEESNVAIWVDGVSPNLSALAYVWDSTLVAALTHGSKFDGKDMLMA